MRVELDAKKVYELMRVVKGLKEDAAVKFEFKDIVVSYLNDYRTVYVKGRVDAILTKDKGVEGYVLGLCPKQLTKLLKGCKKNDVLILEFEEGKDYGVGILKGEEYSEEVTLFLDHSPEFEVINDVKTPKLAKFKTTLPNLRKAIQKFKPKDWEYMDLEIDHNLLILKDYEKTIKLEGEGFGKGTGKFRVDFMHQIVPGGLKTDVQITLYAGVLKVEFKKLGEYCFLVAGAVE